MAGKVVAICISPEAKKPMVSVQEVKAIAGAGLEGDRYCTGQGSYNKNEQGKRQVTLMNVRFFKDSGFTYAESRRNLFIEDVDLNALVNKDFTIGGVRMRGVKYCIPCAVPSVLSGNTKVFKKVFEDCGGIIAEILDTGLIKVGDTVIPLHKGY